jgi:hypothetical protein
MPGDDVLREYPQQEQDCRLMLVDLCTGIEPERPALVSRPQFNCRRNPGGGLVNRKGGPRTGTADVDIRE